MSFWIVKYEEIGQTRTMRPWLLTWVGHGRNYRACESELAWSISFLALVSCPSKLERLCNQYAIHLLENYPKSFFVALSCNPRGSERPIEDVEALQEPCWAAFVKNRIDYRYSDLIRSEEQPTRHTKREEIERKRCLHQFPSMASRKNPFKTSGSIKSNWMQTTFN